MKSLLLSLLFLASVSLLHADTIPDCTLSPKFDISFASDVDLQEEGIVWPGYYLEGWATNDYADSPPDRNYLLVLSRTTRPHGCHRGWKIMIHLTVYTRPFGSKSRWRKQQSYEVRNDGGDGAIGIMHRSVQFADADSNGIPEVYVAITSSTADGGGWDDACVFTNIFTGGKRYEVIMSTTNVPLCDTYDSHSRYISSTRGEAAITPTTRFAFCHMAHAYAVREFRNSAFMQW